MLIELIATGFFAGKSPIAPGTVGTLVGIPIVLFLSIDRKVYIGAILILFFLGWLCAEAIISKTGEKDPEEVVIDEIVGYMASFLFVEPTYKTILLAFLLFRVIDVLKPFPVNLFENFPGGLGVMADDLVGGILTSFLLYLLLTPL